jgi:putative chitinase
MDKDKFWDAFEDCDEKTIDACLEPLNAAMEEFEINTPKRTAMFLAQCCHESSYFRVTKENLNYKAEGLMKIFPKYFRDADPADYAHNPEKIANRVYANRMGNGDEESGDGWKHCGRGYIQLTGKSNYEACGEALDVDLDENPLYLTTPEGAARSAAWFWHKNGLNKYADADDILTCTKRINGGTIGLEERTELWKDALEVFNS